jgi:hypothetical protein
MIPRVVEMFSWEHRVLQRLEEKKLAGAPTLVEKQHRMVQLFFRKTFRCDDRSKCESFAECWF